MICPQCGLPDSYRGDGDGIGSCDCSRCDCCGAGPDDCCCRRVWGDEFYDGVFDPLCNDAECGYRQARIRRHEGAALTEEGGQ